MLDCPVWAPLGGELIFENTGPPTGKWPRGVTSLFRYDLKANTATSVLEDWNFPCINASWSPDEKWFVYYSPGRRKLLVYSRDSGLLGEVANEMGTPVVWHPSGSRFLFVDTKMQAGSLTRVLMQYDAVRSDLSRIALREGSEVLDAAWSPMGKKVVVVMRKTDGNRNGNSRLWLVKPDGAMMRPLGEPLNASFGSPRWSADGGRLLFHRTMLGVKSPRPEIVLLKLDDTPKETILCTGSQPEWGQWKSAGVPAH